MTAAAAQAAGQGLSGEFKITLDGVEYPVAIEDGGGPPWTIIVNGRSFTVKLGEDGVVLVDGIAYDVSMEGETVRAGDASYTMDVTGLSVGRDTPAQAPIRTAAASARSAEVSGGVGDATHAVVAIMPGQVTRVMVHEGQKVEEGEAVCVLEAMKMENELRTDRGGVVKAVHVQPGDDVEKDQVLVEVE
jgi:biotin carboxyl carrier protein